MGVLVWQASSNTRLSCFIRGPQTLENNKNVGPSPLGFHYFLVFEAPDEMFKLAFELLDENAPVLDAAKHSKTENIFAITTCTVSRSITP